MDKTAINKNLVYNFINLPNEVLPDRVIKHFIADGTENRMNQVVNMNGGIFEGFNKTKTALFNHNSDAPIGKNNNLIVTSDGIIAYTRFGTDSFSNNIYNLHKNGILNSWSMRYIPIEDNFLKYLEDESPTWNIDKWELIEYSSTPIPANPNAIDIIKNNCTSEKLLREIEFIEIKNNYDLIVSENKTLKELCNELKTNFEKITPVDLTEIKNEIEQIKNNLPKDVGTVAKTLTSYDIDKIMRNAVSGAVSELTGRKI